MRLSRIPEARLLLACVALAAAAACGSGQRQQAQRATAASSATPTAPGPQVQVVEDPLDVPYVPTPTSVVAKMLDMAKVGPNDVVYDLGSGDGRIVITAVKDYGARKGVGYDLNPKRIQEANANAKEAGVTDRVQFLREDLFEANIKEATVVTLYLLPDVNLKLRPKLLRELKPGTRVVSHNYSMGDWKPVEEAELEVLGVKHYVYSWVVPPGGKLPK